MAPRKKEPRRKPNTGSIRHKPGRDYPYEAAFPIGRDRHRYDSFKTRSEAAAHLDKLTAERDSAETPRNIAGGSQRVDTFLQTWLLIKRRKVKPKTLEDYKYMCELAIGEIGSRRLDSITRDDAELMLDYFHERGFQNVSQLRMVMRQAFQYAEDEDYIKKNPFQRAKAAPVQRRKGIALSIAQRTTLLDAGAIEDDAAVPLAPLWHFYARLGFRRGEGLGPRWSDIKQGVISVEQTIIRVKAATEMGTPKTSRAWRHVPLPDDILELLDRHRTAQRKRAAADPDWIEHGLIFPYQHGGPIPIWYVWRRWEKLRERAGMPEQLVIHDLRHTALTILEQSGTPLSVVQAIAGHSSATMTRHYTDHADIDAMRNALGG
jgi:integrase